MPNVPVKTDKPPYRVSSIEEIKALPWNGIKVASTFSGCGGSSLGYRMAGCRVLYANEFVEAARDTYQANAAPYTYLDSRDIRTVTSQSILELIGLNEGELDILDGSPPCASFSTAGSRQKGWGQVKKYSDTEQRSDDLFFEYARLVQGIQPKVFIAENVSGLVKGSAKGYFKAILAVLKSAGYQVSARLLDAQWLGVPQARQRLIFIGVRNDLKVLPVHPAPLPYRYSFREAIALAPNAELIIRDGVNGNPALTSLDTPTPTVMAHGIAGVSKTQAMLRNSVGPDYDDTGNALDPETGQKLSLEGYAIAVEYDRLQPGKGSSKYLNLTRSHLDRASPTVTATAGAVAAAGVTHATERRKFTLQELRRVCAFPDDFILTGSYSQRWERLGRAVPPVMMKEIANTVCTKILTA